MTETPTRREKVKAWFGSRKIALTATGLVSALLFLLLWPYIAITVHSGEVGVLYSRLFGGTKMDDVYTEGLHFILPWDVMYIYDIRLQQENVDIPILSRGGLTVHMKASLYFYPIVERLPELHRDICPQYKEKLIQPIITASIRNTVGSYWPEDLYTSAPLKLQDEIMVQAVEQMARKPVVIDSLVVGGITLPQQVNEAIDLKFAAEQEFLRYKYVLLTAGEKLKERHVQAESIRLFQETVNRGLTENFLRWSGIEATKELAASQNAKFVIIGGRDGMPVILNTDSQTSGGAKATQKAAPPATTAQESVAPQAIDQGSVRTSNFPDWKAFTDRFQGLQDSLKKYNDVMQQNLTWPGPTPKPTTAEEK